MLRLSRAVVVLGLLAGLASAQPPTTPPVTPTHQMTRAGIYIVNVAEGWDEYIGPYANPSVDPEGRWLYADDGRGKLVRWQLDALDVPPAVFAEPPAGEPGYRFAVAAPRRGLVAAFQAFLDQESRDPRNPKVRVAVSFLTRDGQRIAGGLPLFYATQRYNGAASIAWRPDGDACAFRLSVGNSAPGVYVFRPSDKDWVQVRALKPGAPPVDYSLQWQDAGRSLTELVDGKLVMRAGSNYAQYRTIPTNASLHVWQDMDTILFHEVGAGLVPTDIEGKRGTVVPGWPGEVPGVGNASLVAVHANGLAWLRASGPAAQAGTLKYSLHYVPRGQSEGKDVFSFVARAGYATGNAGPVWHPNKAAVFVSVPRMVN